VFHFDIWQCRSLVKLDSEAPAQCFCWQLWRVMPSYHLANMGTNRLLAKANSVEYSGINSTGVLGGELLKRRSLKKTEKATSMAWCNQ
jgi:hypothetical protein